jgi:hypothetical protein
VKSIKIHEDTLAALRAVKARSGGSYDSAIASILKKQTEVVEPLLHCTAQLDRIETLLLEIKDQSPAGTDVKTKSGAFVIQ